MRTPLVVLVVVLTACSREPAPPAGDDTGSTAAADDSTSAPPSDETTDGSPASTSDGDSSGEPTTGGFPPPVLDECITDGSAGDHTYECEGLHYDTTIPEACLQAPCGLIFDVHGFTMSGQMQEANTHLRQLGSARGYIVVQPSANPAPPAASWNPATDDDKVIAFMLRMADAFHVDPDRLHFTGFSQGGFMSWRMVCRHADVLASVAPAAACGGAAMIDDCDFTSEQPSLPVDVLFAHGVDDVLVPYACAPARRDAVVAAYGLGPEELVEQGDGYTWTRHTGDDGTVMELITHEYSAENTVVLGGHCYLGSDDPGTAPGQLFSYACIDPGQVLWGEAVLDFFDAHPRD